MCSSVSLPKSMSQSWTLARFLVAGIVAGCALGACNTALADARLEEARFYGSPQNPPTVHVGAEGGHWVIMKSPGITYQFSYYVKANRQLRWISVGNSTVPPADGRAPWTRGDIRHQHTAWGDGSFFLPNGQLGEDRATVLQACNDLLAQGKTTAEQHETFARLRLVAEVRVGASAITHQVTDTFSRLAGETMVKVVCEPEPARYEIVSVMLKANPNDQTCPKNHRLDVHFRRHSAGEDGADVTFRVVVDGEAGDRITMHMTKADDTTFQATYHGTLSLDPGEHRIKVKVVGGPESEERTVTVSCPPLRITSITLRYDMGGNSCPKIVFETTRLYVTRPDWVDYRIVNRSGGAEFSNRVKAFREGDGYVAVGQRVLKLGAHDAEYLARSGSAYSDWQRLTVTCPSGASGEDQQPTPPRGPRTDPPRGVSIPPTIIPPQPPREPEVHCPRGFEKVGQRCVAEPCPEGMQRKHGRCERVVVDCPRDLKRVGNACVRDPKPVSCVGGKMVRGHCVTTPTVPDSSAGGHGKGQHRKTAVHVATFERMKVRQQRGPRR
jgi:hypothetical protein